MTEKILELEKQIKWMQEIIIAIILLQGNVTQFRLRKSYPILDEMFKKMWI